MPSFANPFVGNVDRKMSNPELMQALRLDIAGELEAIYLYDAHYLATDDPMAKKVLADIRDEEKAHVGELITLMRCLDPAETAYFLEGEGEVKEMLEELSIRPVPLSIPDAPDIDDAPEVTHIPIPTVGDLTNH